ncbi:MAG: hypothetical protein Q8L27_02775 [archaeon]|nr:hypothetical protein [archaeon]
MPNLKNALLSTSLASLTGLVAILNSGCASDDGSGSNWGAALLEIGSAAAQIHGATNTKITPQQRVNSMVIGNSLHNLAVMENNRQAARIGQTTVVVNQPQQTQFYAPSQNLECRAFACNEPIYQDNTRVISDYHGKGKREFDENEPIQFCLETFYKKGSVVAIKLFEGDNEKPFNTQSKVIEQDNEVENISLNNPRNAGNFRCEWYIDGSPEPIKVTEINVITSVSDNYRAFACNNEIQDNNKNVTGYEGKGKIEFKKDEKIKFELAILNKKGSVVSYKVFKDENKEPFSIENMSIKGNNYLAGCNLLKPNAGKYRCEWYIDGGSEPIGITEIKVVASESDNYQAFSCHEIICNKDNVIEDYRGKGKTEFRRDEKMRFTLRTSDKKGSVVSYKVFKNDNKEPFYTNSIVLKEDNSVVSHRLNYPPEAKYKCEWYVNESPQPVRVTEMKVIESIVKPIYGTFVCNKWEDKNENDRIDLDEITGKKNRFKQDEEIKIIGIYQNDDSFSKKVKRIIISPKGEEILPFENMLGGNMGNSYGVGKPISENEVIDMPMLLEKGGFGRYRVEHYLDDKLRDSDEFEITK